MNTKTHLRAVTLVAAALVLTLACAPSTVFGSPVEREGSPTARDSARDAEARLNKSQFTRVSVAVKNGIATLSGTVDLYQYKIDAEKRVARARGVKAVRNQIQVSSAAVTDEKLQKTLVDRLSYDRVGFGNMFNAIAVKVDHGAVWLEGHARTYVDRDSAVALVAITPGVVDIIDTIEVDPVSIMDDEIRFKVAHAVYGDTALNKYSLDPAKPIRISVQDGRVSLYGIVDSRMDADIAYMRANGVPGVFQVNSYLKVPGDTSEKSD